MAYVPPRGRGRVMRGGAPLRGGRGRGARGGHHAPLLPLGSAYTVIYNQRQESLVAVKKTHADWFNRTAVVGLGRLIANNPGQHVYPGGGLGHGEDPRVAGHVGQAAIREWQEETGLRITGVPPTRIEFPLSIHLAMAAAGYDATPIPISQVAVSMVPPGGGGGRHYGALYLQISDVRMGDIVGALQIIEASDRNNLVLPGQKMRKDDELLGYEILPQATARLTFTAENAWPHPHAPRYNNGRMATGWFDDMARLMPAPVPAPALTAGELTLIATRTRDPALLAMVARYATADGATLHAVVANVHRTPASDAAVVANANVLHGDLTVIAGRTAAPQAPLLAVIAAHPHADGATLHAVVANVHSAPASDAVVVANANVLHGDLTVIAGRTAAPQAALLAVIAAHPHADGATLHAVVANGQGTPASDAAVVANANVLHGDLTVIAGRTAAPEAALLAVIAAHPHADGATLHAVVANGQSTPASDAAVVARQNVLAADLITIANRRPELRAQIRAHTIALANPLVMAAANPLPPLPAPGLHYRAPKGGGGRGGPGNLGQGGGTKKHASKRHKS
jgi:hypothetical protein